MARGFDTEMALMGTDKSYFRTLPKELQAKRDRMAQVLRDVGLKPIIPQGGYFMIADASNMSMFAIGNTFYFSCCIIQGLLAYGLVNQTNIN